MSQGGLWTDVSAPAKTNAWRSAVTAADSLQRTSTVACRGNAAAQCTHTQTLSIYMCKQLQGCNMIQIHEACIMWHLQSASPLGSHALTPLHSRLTTDWSHGQETDGQKRKTTDRTTHNTTSACRPDDPDSVLFLSVWLVSVALMSQHWEITDVRMSFKKFDKQTSRTDV